MGEEEKIDLKRFTLTAIAFGGLFVGIFVIYGTTYDATSAGDDQRIAAEARSLGQTTMITITATDQGMEWFAVDLIAPDGTAWNHWINDNDDDGVVDVGESTRIMAPLAQVNGTVMWYEGRTVWEVGP